MLHGLHLHKSFSPNSSSIHKKKSSHARFIHDPERAARFHSALTSRANRERLATIHTTRAIDSPRKQSHASWHNRPSYNGHINRLFFFLSPSLNQKKKLHPRSKEKNSAMIPISFPLCTHTHQPRLKLHERERDTVVVWFRIARSS